MWRILIVTSFLYLFYLLGGIAQPPPPGYPRVPESFTAEVHLIFQNILGQYTTTGEGHIGRDYDKGNEVINLQLLKYGTYNSIYYQLKLLELKKEYLIEEGGRFDKYCFTRDLEVFDEVWGWLKSAKYMGIVEILGNYYEEWNTTDNRLSLLVNQTHRRIPVRYIVNYGNNVTIIDFKLFHREAPKDPDEFEIPKICTSPLPSIEDLN